MVECTIPIDTHTPPKGLKILPPPWTLYVDGAVNAQGAGAGILFHGPREIKLEYALQFTFPLTNNEAEYEAMITGLKLAKELGIAHLLVKGDSKLVIEQIRGDCFFFF